MYRRETRAIGRRRPSTSQASSAHLEFPEDLVVATTTEGHSASASSSSQPFLFACNHPLIDTSTSDDGCDWDYFDTLEFVTYNLDEMFTEVRFGMQDRQKYSSDVKCSKNLGRGCHPIAWVNSLIKSRSIPSSIRLSYTADLKLDAFEKGLVPFEWSLDNRPDGVVLGSFDCDGDNKWKLPLCILEVHSSPYKNTVSQTAADVIDQLRLLRCFDAKITECVGFTFPKYPDSGHNRTCVTKVTVSFKKFRFVVRLNPLEIHHVETEIVRALESALTFRADYYPIFRFIQFSPDDIAEAARSLHSRYKVCVVDVQQHATKHSMLLKSDTCRIFWKFVPRTTEVSHIHDLHTLNNVSPIHVTLYDRVDFIGHSLFFAFPAHLPTLAKGEVKECLRDFMMKTATALKELHGLGFAHLDVRIPNICFSQNDGEYIVKLIDLDRSLRDAVVSVSSYKGEMYKKHHGWTTSRCDWKQLGLLAAEIILGIHDHTTIVEGEGWIRMSA